MLGGGDCDECYERVLYDARKSLSWKAGTQRVLVLIGDANPHEVGYRYGGTTYELDWRKEAKLLYDKLRVKIYSVQALDNSGKQLINMSISMLCKFTSTL